VTSGFPSPGWGGAFIRNTAFDQDEISAVALALVLAEENSTTRRNNARLTRTLSVAFVAEVNSGYGPRQISLGAHTLRHRPLHKATWS